MVGLNMDNDNTDESSVRDTDWTPDYVVVRTVELQHHIAMLQEQLQVRLRCLALCKDAALSERNALQRAAA